jgi:hypothetical protein
MSRLVARSRCSPLLIAALVLSGAITGPGCASSDGMVDKLYDTTRAYNRSLRWGDWDRAAEYIPTESADAFMEAHQAVEDRLVVLDYEMTRMEVDKLNGIAASQVEISWHTETELVVRTTKVNHLWQWHEGNWVLVDERREGGKPLAIFAEIGDGETHPYLPGLEAFRDEKAIGVDDEEKRKRDRAQRKADKANPVDPTQKYSLDGLDSMPIDKRPPSFN